MFDKSQDARQSLPGIGGEELSEMNELLHNILEPKDDIIGHKKAVKKRKLELDEAKERVGKELIAASSKRRTGEYD